MFSPIIKITRPHKRILRLMAAIAVAIGSFFFLSMGYWDVASPTAKVATQNHRTATSSALLISKHTGGAIDAAQADIHRSNLQLLTVTSALKAKADTSGRDNIKTTTAAVGKIKTPATATAASTSTLSSIPPASAAATVAAATFPNDCNKLLQMVEERLYDTVAMSKLISVSANAACPINKNADGQVVFVNGLIAQATSDPYTQALDTDAARKQNAGFAGTDPLLKALPGVGDGGVGVGFRYANSVSATGKRPFLGTVFRVYPNSPAANAGIVEGDVITQVDGQNVLGKDGDTVLNSIRGAVNTQVVLTVLRHNEAVTFVLVRRVVQSCNVFVKDLGNGYFSIIVDNFMSKQTPDRIYQAIKSTSARAKGYVIDIRNNPGGLVDSGIQSAELFIRDGLVISDREREIDDHPTTDPSKVTYIRNTWNVGAKTYYRRTDDQGKLISSQEMSRAPFSVDGKPVVVLMNENTASAAEIFASAVKGNKRTGALSQGATIVGEPSFGKGVGQTNPTGPDGTKVRVTYLHYFTPSGAWLGDGHNDKHPLLPDLFIGNDKEALSYSADDKQLQQAVGELQRQVYKNWQAAHNAATPESSVVGIISNASR